MKVMILANSSKGLYAFRNEVVLRLLQEYEVVISMPDDVCKAELEAEGCKIIHTPINRRGMNPVEDMKLIKAYKKLLKEEKPELVLTYTIKPNIYGGLACRLQKVPYMSTITGLGSAFQKEGMLRLIIIKMYQAAMKKAECIFFQNQENQEVFAACKIAGKSEKRVTGSGVNLEEHPYEEYPQDEKIKFLFVGRILREKGIEEFLQAAKKFSSPDVSFEILGACDEDYTSVLDKYEKDGIIVQHGFQKNVNPYLKACSALVLPTFYPEGMSNVLMEASATGRPVIGTNIAGSREIIEDGITGYICEPQNAESLIDAIQRFLELSVNERIQMGKAARAKMEREFDRKKVVEDYMKEIHKCLG